MIAGDSGRATAERQRYLHRGRRRQDRRRHPRAPRGQPACPDDVTHSRDRRDPREMERAEAARLQPHHVEAFFAALRRPRRDAAHAREPPVRDQAAFPPRSRSTTGSPATAQPVVNIYHRVTFDPKYVRVEGNNHLATLLHPGHPLWPRRSASSPTATTMPSPTEPSSSTGPTCHRALRRLPAGARRHRRPDRRATGKPQVISRRAQYVRVDADGTITPSPQTPIPNLEPPTDDELRAAEEVLNEPWSPGRRPRPARHPRASVTVGPEPRRGGDCRGRSNASTRPKRLVRERLTREINYWDHRAFELGEQERAGKKTRLPADECAGRAEALARRLDRRVSELDQERDIAALRRGSPAPASSSPRAGSTPQPTPRAQPPCEGDVRIERLAVDAVLRVETPRPPGPRDAAQQPRLRHRVETPDGLDFIEVKGRVEGGNTFVLDQRQEAVTALNKGAASVLALVRVHA